MQFKANYAQIKCFSLPGVGKTTLVKKVCDAMVSSGVSVSGFYTEEVRERGRRVGFDVVTLTGDRGRLSRLRYCLCLPLHQSAAGLSVLVLLSSTNTLSVFIPALNPPQVDVNTGSDSTPSIFSHLRVSHSLFSKTYVWMDDINNLCAY